MKEITYIFGAGASFQSMPLVKNFPDRFNVMLNFLRSNDFNSSNLERDCMEFQSKVKTHSSFDTFFKKLFHQNELESINKFKKVLLIYFLFEHLIDVDNYKEYSSEKTNKDYNVDPRYEALIAGLLKPIQGETEFYTNVNFITWNYDVNLLIGLRNFISANAALSGFINNPQTKNVFKIGNQIKVFHLNGFIYHPLLDNVQNPGIDINSAFQALIDEYHSNSILLEYASKITFAWEGNNMNIGELQNAIANSSTIIIVGYSLPLYNRTVDSSLLNLKLLENKSIIVQDLDAKTIGSTLESDFDIHLQAQTEEAPEVELYGTCNSFIVPRQIFK